MRFPNAGSPLRRVCSRWSAYSERPEHVGMAEVLAAANGPRKGAVGCLGTETVESRLHEARQRLELVPALEHGRDAGRHRRAAARELPEAVRGHAHVHEVEILTLVCVESRRDEHELRVEAC